MVIFGQTIIKSSKIEKGVQKIVERIIIMKKKYAVLTILLCIVFLTGFQKAANGGLVNDNGEAQASSQESNMESQKATLAELSEDAQDLSSQTDEESVSVMEAFRSVLLNEAAFSCTDKVPGDNINVIQQFNGFLNEIPYGYKNPAQVCRFGIVDMDGDSMPEVVLEIEDYYGFLILRNVDGQIQGNFLDYRAMYSLKENGSFRSENSAFEVFINKLYFIRDTVVADKKIHKLMSNYDETSYSIDDISVGKEDYERANALYEGYPEVEWHDYTEEAVNEFIVEAPSLTESARETAKERQAYLDSLSYLIDLTYDYSRKTEEEFHADGKRYYVGCHYELKKIYQLCTEKLTGEALEALAAEQQRWEEENKKEPEEDALYYEYGDKALRRILRLINAYYGYDYYDWIEFPL